MRPKLIDITGEEPVVRDAEVADADPAAVLKDTIDAALATSWSGNKDKVREMLNEFDWLIDMAIKSSMLDALSITLDPRIRVAPDQERLPSSTEPAAESEPDPVHMMHALNVEPDSGSSSLQPSSCTFAKSTCTAGVALDTAVASVDRRSHLDDSATAVSSPPPSARAERLADIRASSCKQASSSAMGSAPTVVKSLVLAGMQENALPELPEETAVPLSQRIMETVRRVSAVFDQPVITEEADQESDRSSGAREHIDEDLEAEVSMSITSARLEPGSSREQELLQLTEIALNERGSLAEPSEPMIFVTAVRLRPRAASDVNGGGEHGTHTATGSMPDLAA